MNDLQSYCAICGEEFWLNRRQPWLDDCHRCVCGNRVCDDCWNWDKDRCKNCNEEEISELLEATILKAAEKAKRTGSAEDLRTYLNLRRDRK